MDKDDILELIEDEEFRHRFAKWALAGIAGLLVSEAVKMIYDFARENHGDSNETE